MERQAVSSATLHVNDLLSWFLPPVSLSVLQQTIVCNRSVGLELMQNGRLTCKQHLYNSPNS